ncbi:predicted protein [Histoplasma capsulatum H143]|uniref:Uncharacterized protein n=1 Tax=Ajellomyces capsulatus (strain H143) TaxID=544712 RepID=C6H600_AJECH|nr:predicted protein [Histoplasma capsulatum H143]
MTSDIGPRRCGNTSVVTPRIPQLLTKPSSPPNLISATLEAGRAKLRQDHQQRSFSQQSPALETLQKFLLCTRQACPAAPRSPSMTRPVLHTIFQKFITGETGCKTTISSRLAVLRLRFFTVSPTPPPPINIIIDFVDPVVAVNFTISTTH